MPMGMAMTIGVGMATATAPCNIDATAALDGDGGGDRNGDVCGDGDGDSDHGGDRNFDGYGDGNRYGGADSAGGGDGHADSAGNAQGLKEVACPPWRCVRRQGPPRKAARTAPFPWSFIMVVNVELITMDLSTWLVPDHELIVAKSSPHKGLAGRVGIHVTHTYRHAGDAQERGYQ
ncbi:hypothetical protein FN846DRAFT_885754 [Sphaerosporella brunnea]|uniref:Uncharacterized protein n=1 Tax=Sphaerosporella brunnea TaxID=1250544 RepID=A0A5J5FC98_9PEZI|nr:hypothetical protein FN846DRAFT_885754 [Sphaerosporella brunnea]